MRPDSRVNDLSLGPGSALASRPAAASGDHRTCKGRLGGERVRGSKALGTVGTGWVGIRALGRENKRGAENKREGGGLPVVVIVFETVAFLDQNSSGIGEEELYGNGVEVELRALLGAEAEPPAGAEDAVERGASAAAGVCGFVRGGEADPPLSLRDISPRGAGGEGWRGWRRRCR